MLQCTDIVDENLLQSPFLPQTGATEYCLADKISHAYSQNVKRGASGSVFVLDTPRHKSD